MHISLIHNGIKSAVGESSKSSFLSQ